jgi:hypothetical protein
LEEFLGMLIVNCFSERAAKMTTDTDIAFG